MPLFTGLRSRGRQAGALVALAMEADFIGSPLDIAGVDTSWLIYCRSGRRSIERGAFSGPYAAWGHRCLAALRETQ